MPYEPLGSTRACLLLLVVMTPSIEASAHTSEKLQSSRPLAGQQPHAATRGFVTDSDLAAIMDLLEKNQFSKARALATRVIARPSHTFSSPKREQFLKANALYFRGEAEARMSDDTGATRDFKQAAAMGDAQSAYQVATILAHQWAEARDSQTATRLILLAQSYLEMGAELGRSECISPLRELYGREGRTLEQHYWFLLERMAASPKNLQKFAQSYRGFFGEKDRALFEEALREHSPTGGSVAATADGIPGRSVLTAAFVDFAMRRQLEFVWRAFFAADTAEAPGVLEGLRGHQRNYAGIPFAAPLLLVHATSVPGDSAIIAFPSRPELASHVLPGDEVVVRCGSLNHAAVVWAIDKPKRSILLLDPFYEFWQPSHNRCIKVFQVRPYKYGRELVSASWPEVQDILEGVIAFRDRVPRK